MRTIVTLLLAVAVAMADPKPGDVGTPEHEKAAALVKQLGDKRFATREAAAKKLIEMGASAMPALNAGTKSADEEVRNRSVTTLAIVVKAEWARRAEAYLSDTEDKQMHELPLLKDWNKMVGKPGVASKKLFAEMVKTNGSLLELGATDRKGARIALLTKSRELLETSRRAKTRGTDEQVPLTAGDIASILFVQSLIEDNSLVGNVLLDLALDVFKRILVILNRFDTFTPPYLLFDPSVISAMRAKDIGPPFRVMLCHWIESRPAGDFVSAGCFCRLAIREPIPEAVPHLLRVVNDTKGVAALAALANAGTPETVTALTGLLRDTSSMWEKAQPGEIKPELRDCALALLAKLKGKDPSDFGLTKAVGWTVDYTNQKQRIVVQLYGFATEEARRKGFEKWASESPKK